MDAPANNAIDRYNIADVVAMMDDSWVTADSVDAAIEWTCDAYPVIHLGVFAIHVSAN